LGHFISLQLIGTINSPATINHKTEEYLDS
jgi:hypothetical protein